MLFGVSSVVAMLAIGEGGSHEAQEADQGAGIEQHHPADRPAAGGNRCNNSVWEAKRYGLTYIDAKTIERTLHVGRAASCPIRETAQATSGPSNRPVPGVVLGTIPANSLRSSP